MFKRLREGIARTRDSLLNRLGRLLGRREPIDASSLEALESALLQADVGVPVTARIMAAVRQRASKETVPLVDLLREEMVKVLQPAEQALTIPKGLGAPFVILVVGVNGAGKTTTIAKLAARAALGRRQQVALVTVDTYRVGGEEQMRIFAELIGVPLVVVRSLEGLASAIDDLAGYARVFIDTAGRSPRDGAAIDETARALAAIAEIETHLTLPAQAPPTVLDAWLRALDTVGVDRLLFTKLDEADELDALVRAPARTAKPVAWVTTGQRVPEDVEDVTAERLLSWATRGLAHREVSA
jgi:flagellar biosynthesis protein FlhF